MIALATRVVDGVAIQGLVDPGDVVRATSGREAGSAEVGTRQGA